MKSLKAYFRSLTDPKYIPTGLKASIVVGSVLLGLNHGSAIINGEMTIERWFAGLLTYIIPYCVNIHGQFSSRYR